MANWIDDPQGREEVDKVTKELKLPIYKPSAKGKFRSWLTEVWGKLEDYLINLKNIANSKEPAISKKTGFNLDKTNDTENDSNKLFTAKGALDLYNELTTAISTKVSKNGDTMNGSLTISNGDILVKTSGKKIIASHGYGYSLYDKNLNSKYLAYIDEKGTIQIGYGADNTPINFQKAPTILNSAVITANEFNVGSTYLANVNANTLIKTGTYGIHSAYATVANNIPYQAWGYLETKVSLNDGSDAVQEFTTIEGSKSYRRYRNNGNWSSWVLLKDYLPLSGGILTGNIVINSAKPYHELKINGVRHMLIGITNSNNDDVVWSASNYGTHIILKSDRVYTNRNIYINNDRVATESWVNTNRTWANLSGKPAFNNTVTSTSVTEIPTPNAVKTAYDRGSAAMTEAGKKLPLTGGTVSGNLNVTGSLKENGNQVFHKGNILRKVWSGNFRASSNGQTICTLPSDWEICFVQFSDRNNEGYLSTSTIFKKHGATYSWIDHEEEISLRIENNVTLKQMTNDSKGDGRIRAVYVI